LSERAVEIGPTLPEVARKQGGNEVRRKHDDVHSPRSTSPGAMSAPQPPGNRLTDEVLSERTDECGSLDQFGVAESRFGREELRFLEGCGDDGGVVMHAGLSLELLAEFDQQALARARRSAVSGGRQLNGDTPAAETFCSVGSARCDTGSAHRSTEGRPNSQPRPKHAPSALARSRWAEVSVPSASTSDPEPSAYALTACMISAISGVARS
jgi:hypothetical protein